MDSKLHLALTVSNIKAHVPITLEKDSTHYTTWKTLFKVHCQIYDVLDHLSPKPVAAASSSDTSAADKTAAAAAEALWSRLDALVLQWIYATISPDLLNTILKPGQTAHAAWSSVESEFNDNKNTRAVFLGQEFANLCLENFQSMADYCQQAKHLADQLDSVGSPVNDRMLVLKILTGLTEQYDGISTVLQNRDPLPDFNEVRSRLTMEETKKKRHATRAAQSAATALAATVNASAQNSTQLTPSYASSDRGRGRTRGRGRGRGRGFSSRGRGYPQQPYNPAHPYIGFPRSWVASQWAGLLQNDHTSPASA
ncbi:uncharacterized protein LOC110932957 [Helianthus annuus]|uniref:uncharacterized protein LOC110932957 n=1 Tax=Helianthus annuus TaxID=4232 RepID=UPI000B8FB80B|nr:uncharacterized protein LOC110932957 [Helianthus annuus]